MFKAQFHEQFKSFTGTDLTAIGREANTFLTSQSAAAKSIAVVANQGGYILSIGYTTEESYPVSVQSVNIGSIQDANFNLDSAISAAAENQTGDVLCHSLLVQNGQYTAVFLIHG